MKQQPPAKQVAALPLRKKRGRVEVLLITSRETKRWIIPKGWPMQGLKDFNAAKREALEEAGVVGRVSKSPLGSFCYVKRRKAGEDLLCEVSVYKLMAQGMLRTWNEKDQRSRHWFSCDEAAKLVQEPQLSALILHASTNFGRIVSKAKKASV